MVPAVEASYSANSSTQLGEQACLYSYLTEPLPGSYRPPSGGATLVLRGGTYVNRDELLVGLVALVAWALGIAALVVD
jgi:hypothetical protein